MSTEPQAGIFQKLIGFAAEKIDAVSGPARNLLQEFRAAADHFTSPFIAKFDRIVLAEIGETPITAWDAIVTVGTSLLAAYITNSAIKKRIAARIAGKEAATPMDPTNRIRGAYNGSALALANSISQKTYEQLFGQIELRYLGDQENGDPLVVRQCPATGHFWAIVKDEKTGIVTAYRSQTIEAFRFAAGMDYNPTLLMPFEDVIQLGEEAGWENKFKEHPTFLRKHIVALDIVTGNTFPETYENGLVTVASQKIAARVERDKKGNLYVATYFNTRAPLGQLDIKKARKGPRFPVPNNNLDLANNMARAIAPTLADAMASGKDPSSGADLMMDTLGRMTGQAGEVLAQAAGLDKAKGMLGAFMIAGKTALQPSRFVLNIPKLLWDKLVEHYVNRREALKIAAYAPLRKNAIMADLQVTGRHGILMRTAPPEVLRDHVSGKRAAFCHPVAEHDMPDTIPVYPMRTAAEIARHELGDFVRQTILHPQQCDIRTDSDGNLILRNLRGVELKFVTAGVHAGHVVITRPTNGVVDHIPLNLIGLDTDTIRQLARLQLALPLAVAHGVDKDSIHLRVANAQNRRWGANRKHQLESQEDMRGTWRAIDPKKERVPESTAWLEEARNNERLKSFIKFDYLVLDKKGNMSEEKVWQVDLDKVDVQDQPPHWQDSNMRAAKDVVSKNTGETPLSVTEQLSGNTVRAEHEAWRKTADPNNPYNRPWEELSAEERMASDTTEFIRNGIIALTEALSEVGEKHGAIVLDGSLAVAFATDADEPLKTENRSEIRGPKPFGITDAAAILGRAIRPLLQFEQTGLTPAAA